MTSPINIHHSGKIIEFSTGLFSVKVLGGWNVKVGNFSFLLKNIDNGRILEPEVTKWRVQSFEFNKRAKKIFSINIPERGNYLIEFKNPKNLNSQIYLQLVTFKT